MRFKEIFKTALFKFSNYPTLLLVSNFKTFLYAAFLALIMVLGIAAWTVPLLVHFGGLPGIADKYTPEFKITDGRLTCDPYTMDAPEQGMYIKVDPTIEGEGTLPDGYPQAMVITATNIVTRNNFRIQRQAFSDMPDLDRVDVIQFFKKYHITLYLLFTVTMFAAFMFSLGINMLVYALLAHISNVLLIRAPLTFGAVFKLTVFAMTFAVILNTLFSLVGLRSVELIAPFITMFYIIKGILQCKNNDGIIIEVLE